MKLFDIEFHLFCHDEPYEENIVTLRPSRPTAKLQQAQEETPFDISRTQQVIEHPYPTVPYTAVPDERALAIVEEAYCYTCSGMRPIGHSCFND